MANKFPLILNTSANQIQEIASGDNLDLTGCKIVGLQGINSAGIVTFTKAHVGAATTWGEDLVVTGNARVTGILTVGTNSVVINGNDVNITGVTTASNFKTGTSNLHNVGIELAGINVLGADTPIGTGATIYNSGAAVFTGIVTAANYVGTINTPAQPNITSVGTLSALNVSGNVSIGGTLTYEDVTNVDAVGLITARAGVNISDTTQSTSTTTGALKVAGGAGIVKNLNVGGTSTFTGTSTFAAAIDANGDLDVDGHTNLDNVSIAGVTTVADNSKLAFGTGEDLSLYHLTADNDGYIKYQNENGHLKIGSGVGGAGGIQLWDRTFAKEYLTCDSDGAVKIFFNDSQKFQTTNTGALLAGTDFGFGATPGGTPASKNVFLAIGDSDTGIVQDGDGQLELWANAVEVANFNAIDGYTSTKPITTTGNVSVGQLTSKNLTLTDNGASGPILKVRADDNAPWAVAIGNDSYHASKGLHFYQENNGDMYQKLFGNSEYLNYFIQQSNSSTTQNVIKIDSNRAVTLYYQGARRLYTADSSSTGVGMYIENGSLEVKHTNDWQLRLWGSDGWAGIQFKDNSNSDQIWYNGSNSTFTIGGGGSNIAGKKLHIDGGTTIGSGADAWTPPANGLTIQGVINVGSGAADNEISAFTNWDAGNSSFNHRGNRTLHSNGSGWDGAGSTDGSDPIIVCSVADRAGNSDIGDSVGLMMHSESQDDNDYSPLIAFSSRSNSGSYNSVYAAIAGRRTGQAADSNWNAGQLNFYTAGKESVRASDQYMDNIPDFFIDRRGFTGTPRHPRFRAYKSGSNWTVNANTDMVWDNTVYNVGGYYSTSNGRFTAPKDGFYYFNFYSITYGSYTNACVYVTVNGNRQSGGDVHFTTGGQWENVGWQGVYKLTAGQYVAVKTCATTQYHGGTWSIFEGYLVSSESW